MVNIGVISYATGSVFLLILTIILLTSWRGRWQGGLLVAASAVSVAWAGFAAYDAQNQYPSSLIGTSLELVRNGLWALFFAHLIRVPQGGKMASPVLRIMVVLAYALPVVLLIAIWTAALVDVPLPWLGFDLRVFGLLLFAVVELALIEQLFRNSDKEKRWAIKYLCFGAGLIFAYDFYLYADASLFKEIDAAVWNARGFVAAIAVPLIAVAAARNPQWSLDVFVSRDVVFHTTALFGAGVYLLIMAAGGYIIRFYGGEWGSVIRDVFLAGAILLLVVLLFSEQIRGRVKVFINKHFFNYKYDYREEWLRLIRTLSTEKRDDSLQERAIRALAEMVDCPGGILFQRQGEAGFRAVRQLNMGGSYGHIEPEHGALVQFLQTWQWVINLDEYHNDGKLYNDLVLPAWLSKLSQAWLVVPLMLQKDLFGFMIIMQPRAKRDFNWEDIDLLKTAGRQVAIHLAEAESAQALTEARQFEAFNRFSAYVVHDLKNLVAQLSLVVSNAKKHKNNPEFMEDAIRTVDNSVGRMNRLLTQLRSGGKKSENMTKVGLETLLNDVLAEKMHNLPRPQLRLESTGLEVMAAPHKLASVVGHIVQNAQEATPDEGCVEVSLKQGPGEAIVEVKDNGAGMDEVFIRERLFRPFDTTKGLTGMGIGVYEAREYIQSLGGTIHVSSQPGKGTIFRLHLPLLEYGAPYGADTVIEPVSNQ